MKTITITEALRELSLYDDKINKAFVGKDFVFVVKTANSTQIKKELKKKATAGYESLVALINNRDKIKSAVIQSNATTEVKINGETMTVAEAIDKKHSIEYKQKLLTRLVNDLEMAELRVKSLDEAIDNEVDDMLKRIAGSDAVDVNEKRKVLEQAYRDTHACEVYDPINAKKKIDELKDEIDGFLKEVDVALSLSNATTTIDIDV